MFISIQRLCKTAVLFFCFSAFNQLLAQSTTNLNTGDFAVLAVNANFNSTSLDEISFVCFKDITQGTQLQILDAGYENCLAGLWSSGQEGGAIVTRTGATITAGTVITFRTTTSGSFNFISPDNGWSTANLFNHPTNPNFSLLAENFNMNSSGDQLYFAQGGVWTEQSTNCTINGNRTSPNAVFPGNNGRMLFGFSTSGSWQSFQESSSRSGLYPGMTCFSMTPTTGSGYNKYTGPLTPTSQTGWLDRISSPSNWTTYSNHNNYINGSPNYTGGLVLSVVSGGNIPTATWTAPISPICADATPINLSTLITGNTGGIWSGTGVNSATFNPSGLNGNYDISYTVLYTTALGNSCPIRQTSTITVNPKPNNPTVISPINYCQNATATALTATGSNLLWYTAASGGTGSTTAPTPNTASVGNTTFYVSQTVSGCESNRASITVQVGAAPSAPIVTTPINYCQGTTASALTATGSNLLWYTAASGGTGSTTAPTPNTSTTGNTIFYVSQTIGGCESNRASITVQVSAAPSAPIVTSPVNYCQGATATALTATGSNLLWYTVASGGTGSTTAPTPNTSTTGNTIFYVSQTIGGCESNRASITVQVGAAPSAPVITTPINYCQGATATTLTATGSNLLWYTAASGGTGSTTAPTPNTSTTGNTIFYVSQTVGGCESNRAAITVQVNARPANPTVISPINYCQNATASALTATGSNLLWYTVASGGTGSATAPIPNTASVGNTTFYVSQTVGGCESNRASITVQVGTAPSAPTVTTPVNYCQGATATTLTATGSNLLWYTATTGGTGSTTAPTPNTSTTGNTIFYVSQTVGGCESNRASITVQVGAAPSAPTVTTPVNYCQNATATALTATGSNLLWYTAATGGTGSTTAPIPNTASVGNTTFYVSQTVGGCESNRASITVQVGAAPSAPIVTTPINYCQGATATALTATGSNLLWYTAATGGTGSTTAPTPNTASVGNITFYVSQTVGGCESNRASITVQVNSRPANPAVISPINYCQGATATALTATGSNLLWYTAATGGTGSTTAPIPNTSTTGNTIFYVSQTIGGCESNRASITVQVSAAPSAPIVTTPVNYCQGATATALTATGSNLLWYAVASGGTGSTTAPTPNTSTTGNTIFYVSQTIGGCESNRASITVQVGAAPSAPTVTTPVNYCQGATASALTATGSNLLWYTAASGGTGSTTAPTPNTASVGNTTFYVSQTVSGCESNRASITVQVGAAPSAPIITTPINYCQGATATALTATGSNLLWYTAATGGTGSTTAPTPNTSTTGNTIFYVSQTVGGCESNRAAITVQVNARPANPTVISAINYCQNATATALTATGSNLLWYTAATGGTGSTTAPMPNTASIGNTTFYVSQTIGGCESNRASITVQVTSLPNIQITVQGGKDSICSGNNAILLSSVSTGNQWLFNNAVIPSATASTLSVNQTGNYSVRVNNGNGCIATSSSKTITVLPNPTINLISPLQVLSGLQEQVIASVSGGNNFTYSWSPSIYLSASNILNPFVINPLTDRTYTLTVTSSTGCRSTANLQVQVLGDIVIPNAFSPNGDNINDTWEIKNLNNYKNVSVQVFNRGGQVVYNANNYAIPWNGTLNNQPLPVGTYYYIISYSQFKSVKSGWIMLIR